MYCKCRKAPEGFKAAPSLDGDGVNYNFWVCSRCGKPTRMVWEKMTMKHVLASALTVLSQDGGAGGRTTLTWAMPDGTKRQTMVFKAYPRKVDMDQGRNVCVELWQMLDKKIDEIRAHPTSPVVEYEKAQANMLAEVIQLVMSPFYSDSIAVLQESMRRWEAREEDREHESPGLAEAVWDPATRFDGTPYSADSEAKVRNVGASSNKSVVFDDQKVAFIKHCMETGAQSPEVLASMFSCTVDDIKAVMS